MSRNFEKIKASLDDTIDDAWTISSIAFILKDSLKYGSQMRKIDRIYLSIALSKIIEEHKNKITDIRKDLFGVKNT